MPEDEEIVGRQANWLVRLGERLIRFRRTRYTFIVIASVLIGLGGGFAAILFRYLIEGATWSFTGGHGLGAGGFAALSWWWILGMPAVGGLLVGVLTTWLAPEARGTGVPEVMEAVSLRGGRIRKRTGVVKAFVVAICLGSGGSAGREGPIIHVGAAIGSFIGSIFKVPVSLLRTFVGCGAAAGIAATFNAPIAGAMFAGEVILGQFGVVSFSAIVISSVVATVVSRHFIGDFPAFIVPAFQLHESYELFFYAVLGLLAGLVGCLFIWGLDRLRRFFERSPIPAYLRPALGGLLVGALGIAVPQVLGVGYGAINAAMHTSVPWLLMLLLLGGKLLATSLTLGTGGSGGIFAPSLFLGAMLGGLIGTGLSGIMPAEIGGVGSYALVAMGALVAATTRAPITAIVIIFEMTNNYSIVLPLMIACILATLLAGQIVKPSIYETKLISRGVNISRHRDFNILRRFKVADVEIAQAHTLSLTTRLDAILELAIHYGDRHYVVNDRDGLYVGLIHMADLRFTFYNEEQLGQIVVAADLVHQEVPTLMPNDTLDTALKLQEDHDLDALPVMDPDDPRRVMGLVTQDAVIEAYNRQLLNLDLAGETAGLMVTAERGRSVDLGDGNKLMEFEAPVAFVGRTLKELDLRRRYSVQVVMLKRSTGENHIKKTLRQMPGPGFVIETGDILLLLGSAAGLKKITGQ